MEKSGSEKLNSQISKSLNMGRPGHAYLLKGENAAGQGLLLAMALNCRNLTMGQPCGVCLSCKRILAGTYADLEQIWPEKGCLRIEQIRKIRAKAGLKALEGNNKVIIINDADFLREEAANSLLKILEEPPSRTVFILTANNGDKLLPTILSRCQIFNTGNETGFFLDEPCLADFLIKAGDFLKTLPDLSCVSVLNTAKAYEKDKEALLYFFLALWYSLADMAKGEIQGIFPQKTALKAGLFVERAIELLRKNINQRLLSDIVLLTLWKMGRKSPQP